MERKSLLLRIDPALWDELNSWAQSELRSINGQIEYLLRQAVQKRKGQSGDLPAQDDDVDAVPGSSTRDRTKVPRRK
jgi:hypothetical protein